MTIALVPLAEIAEVRLGRQRSPKDHDGPQMRPYVRAANIGWGGLLLEDVKHMNFTDAEMDVYALRPGDLLLNEASGSAREVGKPALWCGELEGCAFQNTLIRVRPHGADPRFLLHFFKHEAASGRFAREARGVGIRHLGQDALARWPVPLPPIDKQRRLADMLDLADRLSAKRRTSVALVNSLAEVIFLEMFRDRANIGSVELGDAVSHFEAGKSVQTAGADNARASAWVLKVSAVTSGRFLPGEAKPVPTTYVPASAHYVRRGDLLFSRANTEALVGATALVDCDPRGLLLSDKLWRFVWRDGAPVLPFYVWRFLQLPETRRAIGRLSTGTSGSMKNVSQARLLTLRMPLPPIGSQEEFERRCKAVAGGLDAAHRAAAATDTLFASLQHRAFSGQL